MFYVDLNIVKCRVFSGVNIMSSNRTQNDMGGEDMNRIKTENNNERC